MPTRRSHSVDGGTAQVERLFKELRMGSGPDKDEFVIIDAIDQQEVASDVAFTVPSPIAGKLMILPLRRYRAGIGDQQQHHLFQIVHVVPTRTGLPLPVFGEPFSVI